MLRRDLDVLDREFGALIDEVIDDETREAAVADAQARALPRRLTLLAVVVVAVSAACAGLTALWVRRRIQAPIDALVEGTRQIARGGLDHRVRVSGRDELANLAVSFNWMVAEVERRRAELDHARADLERKVQERTVELEQRNRTLRQVDQARRRMFADISHAFRTPLTVIRGEAEVTLRAKHGTADDYRATLARIVETAAQLNKLVEELLEVARSESAAVPLETTDVAATELIRDVGEDANALAATKGIRVSCGVPRHEIHIRGDADRLRQLLLILLDNACRYTPADGEIAITPGGEEAVRGGDRARHRHRHCARRAGLGVRPLLSRLERAPDGAIRRGTRAACRAIDRGSPRRRPHHRERGRTRHDRARAPAAARPAGRDR